MRVVRVYHEGRDVSRRARERALAIHGDVILIAPSEWPGTTGLHDDGLEVIELPISRAGDVNRHKYAAVKLGRLLADLQPDVLDIHEEPFSIAGRQWLSVASRDLPVLMYTAQNVDKRFPPPFAQHERASFRRVAALYPCSAQAAAVARGKGFDGLIDVLPLGYDDGLFYPGAQRLDDDELILALVGRLVSEKGVADAVRILAQVHMTRPARLVVVGEGPEGERAARMASQLGVADRVEFDPWAPAEQLAAVYRHAHVVLVPSRPTATWVEQFGRVIVEAQASGAVVAGYASGSIPEVAGDAALLADVGRSDDLAAQILALADDAAAFERRRERGFELSRTRTWSRVAAAQAALYECVIAGETPRLALPRSPTVRRRLARKEFGSPASTVAGERPFALPVLREGGALPGLFGRAIDQAAELRASLNL